MALRAPEFAAVVAELLRLAAAVADPHRRLPPGGGGSHNPRRDGHPRRRRGVQLHAEGLQVVAERRRDDRHLLAEVHRHRVRQE